MASRLSKYLRYYVHDAALAIKGSSVIHCIGDSHVSMFKYLALTDHTLNLRFRWCIIRGATASGIPNPRSLTQAGKTFGDYLQNVPRRHLVLTCLGEVDCGFVIWYRSRKYDEPVDSQLQRSLEHYFQLLQSIKAMGHRNPIVCSVPLPTILDGQTWGEVANLRREVSATLRQRTDLTLCYNRALRAFCRDTESIFLDLEFHTLEPETGLLNARFRNADPLNHHLSNREMMKIIPIELKKHGLG